MHERMISDTELDAMAKQAQDEGYKYLLSVVMAVYNAAEYLEEAIDSVINQSIGMKHTQIVLVNDGSEDDSKEICESYLERFPQNIVYVEQENSGVSVARNNGIDRARGKYINFLDSDDKWTEDSFDAFFAFFRDNGDIRLASSRYVMFDAKSGGHRLNYKYDETRVIDLLEVYDCPQLSSSTCFFDASVFENHRYNDKLSVSEDTLLVNEILLDDLRYGVVHEPTYMYRQRATVDSAIDTMKENVSWYFDTMHRCYEVLFRLSQARYGRVLPFIQYVVMYDLQWRIRAKKPEVLDEEQIEDYKGVLVGLLKDIDDKIISEQKTISIDQVAFAFSLKYGVTMDDVLDRLEIDGDMLCTRIEGKEELVKIRPLQAMSDGLTLDEITATDSDVTIGGYLTSFRFPPKSVDLVITANNKPLETELFVSDKKRLQNPFDQNIVGKTGFYVTVPVKPGEEKSVKATLTVLGSASRAMRYKLDEEFPIKQTGNEGDYIRLGNFIVRVAGYDSVVIRHAGTGVLQDIEKYQKRAKGLKRDKGKAAKWKSISLP